MTETSDLNDHYIGMTNELNERDVKPAPPIMFQITAHSRVVYEVVVLPLFEIMAPAPRVLLIQFAFGTHGFISSEVVKGVNLGVTPAVFQQWDDAIKGGLLDELTIKTD